MVNVAKDKHDKEHKNKYLPRYIGGAIASRSFQSYDDDNYNHDDDTDDDACICVRA